MDANKTDGLGLTPVNPKLILGGVMNLGLVLDRRSAVASGVAQAAAAQAKLLTNPPADAVGQIEGFWRATIGKRFLVASIVMAVPMVGPENPDHYVLAAPVWTKGGMPVGQRVVIRFHYAGSPDVWIVEIGERTADNHIRMLAKTLIPLILGVEDVEELEWCHLTLPATG